MNDWYSDEDKIDVQTFFGPYKGKKDLFEELSHCDKFGRMVEVKKTIIEYRK